MLNPNPHPQDKAGKRAGRNHNEKNKKESNIMIFIVVTFEPQICYPMVVFS